MKRTITFFVIAIALAASAYLVYTKYYTQRVMFLVSNDSDEEMPPIKLEIFVDGSKLIQDYFIYSNIQPHHTSYEERMKKGKHLIEVKSNGKVKIKTKKEIELNKPLYVFISFHYDTLIGKEIKAQKMIFYMLHDSTTTKFRPDSLIKRKDIVIHVMDKEPIHQ